MDLITLNISDSMGFQTQLNPDEQFQSERRGRRGYADEQHDVSNPIRHWAMGIIRGEDFQRSNRDERNISYPGG